MRRTGLPSPFISAKDTVTGTKSLSIGGNYTYNGSTGAQSTGALLPTTVHNLTINNSDGVSIFNASDETLDSTGIARFTGSNFAVGLRNVYASYAGDTYMMPSNSPLRVVTTPPAAPGLQAMQSRK